MERNVLVDRLKGYACFLVLFGHVIMGIRLSGVAIPAFFWGLEKFIWSFHVALFLFLSGVVYRVTGEWKNKKTKSGFIIHKLYTLGVPYIAFSAVYVLINSFVGGVNTGFSVFDLLNIWKTPIAQYWFLYALFFLFVIWSVFSGILKNWQITVIITLAGLIAELCGFSFGAMDIVVYSALAFGTGTFVDFDKLTKPRNLTKWLIVFMHIASGILFVYLNIIEALFVKELMILIGIYSSIVLISMIQKYKIVSRFFDFVNKYSFQIYVLHTIFTAGIRIILIRVGVTEWTVHVIAGTVCGLAFSVLAAEIAKRFKFLNFWFFPAKSYPLKRGEK